MPKTPTPEDGPPGLPNPLEPRPASAPQEHDITPEVQVHQAPTNRRVENMEEFQRLHGGEAHQAAGAAGGVPQGAPEDAIHRAGSTYSEAQSGKTSCISTPRQTPPSNRRLKPAMRDDITANIWSQSGNRVYKRQEAYGDLWAQKTLDAEKERALIDFDTIGVAPIPSHAKSAAELMNTFTNPLNEPAQKMANPLQGPVFPHPFSQDIPPALDPSKYTDNNAFILGLMNSMNRYIMLSTQTTKRTPREEREYQQLHNKLQGFDTVTFRNQALVHRLREQQEFDLRFSFSNDLYQEIPVLEYYTGSYQCDPDRPRLLSAIKKQLSQSFYKNFTTTSPREEFSMFFHEVASITKMNRMTSYETYELLSYKCDYKLRKHLQAILTAKIGNYKSSITFFMTQYGKPKTRESMLVKFNKLRPSVKNFRENVQEIRRVAMSAFEGESEESINRTVSERLMLWLSDHINRMIARERQKRRLAVQSGIITNSNFEGESFFEYVILTVEEQSINPATPILRFKEQEINESDEEEYLEEAVYEPETIHQVKQQVLKEENKPERIQSGGSGSGAKPKNLGAKPKNKAPVHDEKIMMKNKKGVEDSVAALEERFSNKPFEEVLKIFYDSGSKIYPSLKPPKFDVAQKNSNTKVEGGKYILNTNPIPDHVFNRRKKNYFFSESALKYFSNHCWRCGSSSCNPISVNCPYKDMETTFKPCSRCKRGLHRDRDCKRAE